MKSRIFRQVSLERLASPEQLDQVMRVVSPGGWMALASVGLLLVALIVWGVAGELSDKVMGRGMLVKSGGILQVVTPAGGRVADISVMVGDSVTAGQIVAWVAQPELLEKLDLARGKLERRRRDHSSASGFASTNLRLQIANLVQRQENAQRAMAATEEAIRWHRQRVATQEELLGQGLVTRATLLASRQQLEQAEEKLRLSRAELVQIAAEEISIRSRQDETLRTGAGAIDELEAEVERLEREIKTSSQIVSPYTGRILEVMGEPGMILQRGEAVLTLDLTGQAVRDLVAVIYVPSIQGKKVRRGMEVQIAPSSVRPEEYGMILGRITFVSSFPTTTRGMGRVLKNEKLVSELAGQGSPYELHADLRVDPHTLSRYRWTSSAGPPIEIQSGTLAAAEITVETQRPIAKVIPLLRKWTGI